MGKKANRGVFVGRIVGVGSIVAVGVVVGVAVAAGDGVFVPVAVALAVAVAVSVGAAHATTIEADTSAPVECLDVSISLIAHTPALDSPTNALRAVALLPH